MSITDAIFALREMLDLEFAKIDWFRDAILKAISELEKLADK